MKTKLLFLALLISLIFNAASALDLPVLEVQASPSELSLGQTINLSFIIRANQIGRLNFPSETEDFLVVGQSTSNSIKIVNGNKSQQYKITLILNPKRVGSFNIPSATIEAQGAIHSSPIIPIKVSAPTSNPTASSKIPAQTGNPVAGSKISAPTSNPVAASTEASKVFAKLLVSNSNPYVGEQIKLRLRIYHQGNLRNINFNNAAFSFDNFVQDKIDGGLEGEEIIDGQKYYYYEIASILFPIQAKPSIINSQKLLVTVLDVNAMKARAFDPFAQLVTRSFEKQENIETGSVLINVKALPKPIPANFSSFVGTLTMNHRLEQTSVEAGNAVLVHTTASGSGNPKTLNLNLISKSNLYTVFEDKKNLVSSTSAGIKSFSLNSRYAVIAKKAGKVNINIAPLVYFDTNKRRYETIPATQLELNVLPSNESEAEEPSPIEETSQSKELWLFSPSEIQAAQPQIPVPIWLLWLIIISINALSLLRPSQTNLKPRSRSELKAIKQASSIEELSILVKEYLQDFPELENSSQFRIFFDKIDALLYSGLDSKDETKLQELKNEALELIQKSKTLC